MMNQTKNRVLAVGGGSAGHVAPTLAVINELAARSPHVEIRFWCDRGFMYQSKALMKHATIEVKVEKIYAGKFRRYYRESVIRRLLDLPTLAHNFIDIFIIILGFFQSLFKLLVWRPDVVFCKGGFVCLPVGYAAAFLRIPLVIHDSDTHPGLTNRLLARFATFIATGAPLEYYNYPAAKARYVGIPTTPEFRHYNDSEKMHTKKLFHVVENEPLLVVIGGGLGAKKINDALISIAPELVKHMSVIHISGMKQYEELKVRVPKNDNYKLTGFLSDHLGRLLGAADVVVSRVGASAMAELAAVSASVIMVPNAQLTGGHQLKNAKVFSDKQAAVVIDESKLVTDPNLLLHEILRLIGSPVAAQELSRNLTQFAKPAAAQDTADLIEQA